MPITYDITKDGLYKEGIERGIEKGIEQGIERGIKKGIERGVEQNKFQMISGLIDQQLLTIEQIAEVAKVTIDQVLKIKAQKAKDA